MNSLLIGTAGHIDHGKTSLIKALNGFEGDTLKEEKDRKITINLSFSNLNFKDKHISFIDVPGHKDLVKTMISGAFGFSACLFVVDINEGLKEQSLEHLEVLELLGIKDIILIFSKCDLCENLKEQSEN
ncbi:50S ribosome-binding GTPase, partial [Campylobacter novaezeelandiae]